MYRTNQTSIDMRDIEHSALVEGVSNDKRTELLDITHIKQSIASILYATGFDYTFDRVQ